MRSDVKKVVWDSCVIIDAIQKTPGRYEKIEPFLKDAENGKLLIVVSELSVAEVSHLTKLTDNGILLDDQVQLIKDWFENPYIVRRPVHAGISELAGEVGRKHKLKRAPDRIIVATALFEKIPQIHTFDGIDPKKKNKLLPLDGQIGDPPLRIREPDPAQDTLFEKRNASTKTEEQETI